jgi:hypothetical protein
MFIVHDLGHNQKLVTREKAVVIDVRDPSQSGNIMVDCFSFGQTNWIPYIMAPGEFQPPKVGDIVYVEAESGIEWAPIAHGKLVNTGKDVEGLQNSLYREVPTVSAWISNGPLTSSGAPLSLIGANEFLGHAILLDDGQQVYGSGSLPLTSSGIKILTYGGNKLYLSDDPAAQQILLADFNNKSTPLTLDISTGNRIVINSQNNTITVEDLNGNSVVLNAANNSITVNSTGKTIVNASEIDLNLGNGSYTIDPQCVLTTSSMVEVDTIYGIPSQGISTVKAGT